MFDKTEFLTRLFRRHGHVNTAVLLGEDGAIARSGTPDWSDNNDDDAAVLNWVRAIRGNNGRYAFEIFSMESEHYLIFCANPEHVLRFWEWAGHQHLANAHPTLIDLATGEEREVYLRLTMADEPPATPVTWPQYRGKDGSVYV